MTVRTPPCPSFLVCLLLCALAVAMPWGLSDDAGTARAEVRNPDGVAVIVGNREYTNPDVPEVSFAHRDADAFRRYVVDMLGFDPENIIDLRDAKQSEMEAAFGNERSHEGVLWRYLNPDGGAAVVVFYSGHGVPGLKDGRGYLLPADANPNTAEINGYPIDLLYGNLAKLGEAASVWVFLDACFSGSSHRGMLVRAASPASVTPSLPAGVAERVTLLTAASGDQVASWDEEAGHGLFTHHLLDALYGAGDGDGDGHVTAQEAKAYLDRHMTRAARRIFGRHQRADLREAGDVVLATASADGAFPARPRLDAPDAVAGDKDTDTTPAVDHAAVETALDLSWNDKVLIQRGLDFLGFDPGPADGAIGPRTRLAVGAWHEAKHYEATGHLTRDQANALIAVGSAQQREQAEREQAERERAEQERKQRETKAQPQTSITVQTVPAHAQVRVFTSAGSTYQEGMHVQPGRYEIAVEARHHEPFRQALAVDGPTTYRIALCRHKSQTQEICEDKPVTRTRTVNKQGRKKLFESALVAHDDIGFSLDWWLDAPDYKREALNEKVCRIAKENLENLLNDRCKKKYKGRPESFGFKVRKRECEFGIGTVYGTLSCFGARYEDYEDYVEMVKECRDEIRQIQVCPDQVVTKIR